MTISTSLTENIIHGCKPPV